MSIWKRFKRATYSLFGKAVNSLENPRTVMEQNIRELNDQVPEMNENIATVKANVLMLENDLSKVKNETNDLELKIRNAINNDREDIAKQKAIRLESKRKDVVNLSKQLDNAKKAYNQSLEIKKVFMREKKRKIQEAKDALRAHERAQWQGKVADTIEQFNMGGLDQTHDEMLNRLRQDTARSEAKMEMALDSANMKQFQLEEDADDLRASEIVDEFKLKMKRPQAQLTK